MSKNIGPFNVCLDIINSDGKDEKNWKLLLPSINKEPTKNLKYLINEFFQYISNNNFNKEIIYDILDYIIDNYNNLEIKNSILDISILGLLSGIIQKKEVEKNVKIKILFLLQKWKWKNINENCLLIYNQIKSSHIILPPKGFQIVTYKKYLKQEIFNENNKSNFYGYNKLDNQENSNKNEYDNKKIIENDDDDFRLLKYLNDIPNSNQNNQNNNNYNNNLSKTSYASNSNYINNNISNPNNNDQINQNNNNLQNQNNNYNNQQNSTPNQNNNYQNHNYPLYNPSNQNNNNYQNQNNNYSNYNYLQNQNNNNRNYNIYPPNNYS